MERIRKRWKALKFSLSILLLLRVNLVPAYEVFGIPTIHHKAVEDFLYFLEQIQAHAMISKDDG